MSRLDAIEIHQEATVDQFAKRMLGRLGHFLEVNLDNDCEERENAKRLELLTILFQEAVRQALANVGNQKFSDQFDKISRDSMEKLVQNFDNERALDKPDTKAEIIRIFRELISHIFFGFRGHKDIQSTVEKQQVLEKPVSEFSLDQNRFQELLRSERKVKTLIRLLKEGGINDDVKLKKFYLRLVEIFKKPIRHSVGFQYGLDYQDEIRFPTKGKFSSEKIEAMRKYLAEKFTEQHFPELPWGRKGRKKN